jgi:hypothetical protein
MAVVGIVIAVIIVIGRDRQPRRQFYDVIINRKYLIRNSPLQNQTDESLESLRCPSAARKYLA